MLQGVVEQVSISKGGIPKLGVLQAHISPKGLDGDSWRNRRVHGGPLQAVLLVTAEGIEELAAQGFRLYPGALGENLTTRGIDRKQMRAGQRFRVGTATIELTKLRTPCATLDVYGPAIKAAIFDRTMKQGNIVHSAWALSGFYASVADSGDVRPGDSIVLLNEGG